MQIKKESFMTSERQHPDALSLIELLQLLRNIVHTTSIPPVQQLQIMQIISEILQASATTTHFPLPGRDMQEIRGQNHVKRALEVAAAGKHNILLIGPHGSGKMLLARTIPSLLPKSASGVYPFRAPHHSIDEKAFIGTAKPISPGELTLAHEGVLLLENIAAFKPPLIAVLRQAVEEHIVTITHRKKSMQFPANFLLVATLEPCPCGFYGKQESKCMCSPEEIAQYMRQAQAVIDSCFDIRVEVRYVGEDILSKLPEEDSAHIRHRVEMAREVQQHRFKDTHFHVNAELGPIDEIQRYCTIDKPGEKLLKTAQQQLHLSAQQVLRIQKVARTIADLTKSQLIAADHIAESIQYQLPLK
jgi:magnesium chelatase family protein